MVDGEWLVVGEAQAGQVKKCFFWRKGKLGGDVWIGGDFADENDAALGHPGCLHGFEKAVDRSEGITLAATDYPGLLAPVGTDCSRFP